MQYLDFVEEVRLMRFAQKQYKVGHDEKWRMERNLREKRIDDLVAVIQESSKISQPNLF